MSKAKAISLIDALSGKVCSNGEYCFHTNKVTGNIYTTRRKRKKPKPPTEAQLANRQRFTLAQHQASLWLREHKGSTEYDQLQTEFLNQHEIGSIIGFLMHKLLKP